MSIDNIFFNRFEANNRFIDAAISDIRNNIEISDINSLTVCCEVISRNEDSFKRNTTILNDVKEKMELMNSRFNKLDVQFYIFDTEQVFRLLVGYSKAVINGDSEERINAIYKNLMYMYDKYLMYKSKFI